MIVPLNNPKAIAEAGERIYRDKYQAAFESEHVGKYAVVNVISETAVVGPTPEEAFTLAREHDPTGVFHLVRIGYPGAFQVSYQYGHGLQDWLFG